MDDPYDGLGRKSMSRFRIIGFLILAVLILGFYAYTTPDSIAHAKKVWGYDCAICHGETGDGNGELAKDMKTPLKDYRNPDSLKDISDGELFYIIQKGKDQMPGEGDRAKPDDIWNLVTVVRSFGKK